MLTFVFLATTIHVWDHLTLDQQETKYDQACGVYNFVYSAKQLSVTKTIYTISEGTKLPDQMALNFMQVIYYFTHLPPP